MAGIFATSPPPRPRRGFTILEFVAAATMFAVLTAVIAQLVVQTNRQAALAERHDYALHAIENAMEALTARDWEQVTEDAIAEYQLSDGLKKRWPAAKLTGKVEEHSDPIEAKRIALELALAEDARGRPISLTTWIYRTPSGEAPR